MTLGKFILVNGLIGVVMYFVTIVVLVVGIWKKYGEKTVDEGTDLIKETVNVGYSAMPEKKSAFIKALCIVLTIFAWQIMDLVNFYLAWRIIADRYDKS